MRMRLSKASSIIKIESLAVEEPFLRSCLPRVDVAPFQTDLRTSLDDVLRDVG